MGGGGPKAAAPSHSPERTGAPPQFSFQFFSVLRVPAWLLPGWNAPWFVV